VNFTLLPGGAPRDRGRDRPAVSFQARRAGAAPGPVGLSHFSIASVEACLPDPLEVAYRPDCTQRNVVPTVHTVMSPPIGHHCTQRNVVPTAPALISRDATVRRSGRPVQAEPREAERRAREREAAREAEIAAANAEIARLKAELAGS
jgi:hypothetical protein